MPNRERYFGCTLDTFASWRRYGDVTRSNAIDLGLFSAARRTEWVRGGYRLVTGALLSSPLSPNIPAHHRVGRSKTKPLISRATALLSRRFWSALAPSAAATNLPVFQFRARFLFYPLSRHCFGASAAPGAGDASALPSAPFRFWLPPVRGIFFRWWPAHQPPVAG